MKIVVIGESGGLIETKLVINLIDLGYEVVVTSHKLITVEGFTEVLSGAQIVIDTTNTPTSKDKSGLDFIETSTRNLLKAEVIAGVRHHVALSVVGRDVHFLSGYFRAKIMQTELLKASKVPYTIVHVTQFIEFDKGIAYVALEGESVRLSSAYVHPISSEKVAEAIGNITLMEPLNGTVELTGPKRIHFDDFIDFFLSTSQDNRKVIVDSNALYFIAALKELTLITTNTNINSSPSSQADWIRHLHA